jgi:predicted subunit of tRNA(5-methylaminomethyl-2-thiouridylate) methyltransferase
MNTAVLYSGGKDSSLISVILKNMGLNIKLINVNFGVFKSYIPASESAKSLSFDFEVLKLDKEILEKGVDIILKDGFPNNGINYIHKEAIEKLSDLNYLILADGTRRDDRIPKLNTNEIQSLEDRKNIQYINLDSFGYKTIDFLANKFFKFNKEISNNENSSDYEVEIRYLIDKRGFNSLEIFPNHYQTRVVGFKKV